MAQQLRNPIGRAMFTLFAGRQVTEAVLEMVPEMEGLVSMYNSGTDYILNNAPVLILFCADKIGGFPSVNANLALQNAALAAEALGLGCFYGGFVARACNRDDSIARLLSLPETHKIYGVLALGYPRIKFSQWPDRKPLRVTWVGAD